MKHRKLIAVLAGIAGGVIIAAIVVVVLAGGSPPFTARGQEETCTSVLSGQTPPDAYPDVTAGSQVTVTDPAGKVIATGSLGPGNVADAYDVTYPFAVTVPGGLSRYGIHIGNPGRGTLWFTAQQMGNQPGLKLANDC